MNRHLHTMICLLAMCIAMISAHAQLPHTFTLFGMKQGLTVKTTQVIMQDRDGYIWLATWDGLCRFDGYSFKTYKAHICDGVPLGSNRFIMLKEANADMLWLCNYDMQVFCFNKMTETFTHIPYPKDYMAETLFTTRSGDVWITTRGGDLIHTVILPDGTLTSEEFYSSHVGQQNHHPVTNSVFETSGGTIWLLTSKGLYQVSQQKGSTAMNIRRHHPGTDFTAACETKDHTIVFAAAGKLLTLHNGRWKRLPLPTYGSVNSIAETHHGQIIIGTSNGLVMCNVKNGQSRLYKAATSAGLTADDIQAMYIDRHGDAWLQTSAFGIVRFTPSTGRFHHYILHDPLGNPVVDSRTDIAVHEDVNGQTFIHPSGGGLGYYDRATDRLLPFFNHQLQNGWNPGNRITTTFSDRQGNLWYSTYYNGLEKASFDKSPFRLINSGSETMNVRATYQDRSGRVWVGTKDGTVRIYDTHFNLLGYLCCDGSISSTRRDDIGMVYSICQTNDGTMWLGTKGEGLIEVTSRGLYRYKSSPSQWSISNNEIYDIKQAADGRLWIATFKGGLNYTDIHEPPGKRKFINHNNRLTHFPIEACERIRHIRPTKNGELWISTTHGLLYVPKSASQPEHIDFRLFDRDGNDPYSITTNDVHGVEFTRSGDMFVLTYGGGFCKFTGFSPDGKARFKQYVNNKDCYSDNNNSKTGIPTDIIFSMAYDRHNNLWMSTESGIMRLSVKDSSSTVFQTGILGDIHMAEGPITRLRNGTMLVNTLEGILTFHPDSMRATRPAPKIKFTGITLTTSDNTSDATMREIFSQLYKGSLTLSHSQNSFTIEFSALDFSAISNIRYAYKLDGFDKQWNYTEDIHSVRYTNIPHGKYTLRVRSTDGEGLWVDNEQRLSVTVKPAWWETPLAYILYAVALLALLAIGAYLISVYQFLRSKVKMEQQLADIKLRFFTDVSHELRTPLTLISSPLEEIARSGTLNAENQAMLDIVQRNVTRMHRLVGQILDFRKIQNGKMKLTCRETDICGFVKTVSENFHLLAQQHSICFTTILPQTTVKVWVDTDKMEKIIFNLLSNAFKYTPDNKSITIKVEDRPSEVLIHISDQGIGIAEEKLQTIFNRFENLADHSPFGHDSTGIGLSLVKQLVDLHNGTISLRSRKYEGSMFTVTLHKGTSLLPPDTELILDDDNVAVRPATAPAAIDDTPQPSPQHSLLIVEDNDDLRQFLHTVFKDQYTVHLAPDGTEGLRIAAETYPDIIISDVMMPNMNGIEMLHAIRNNAAISHIPVILLTAKTDVESQVEGLAYGADDYITKPFSATYLRARISNILLRRQHLVNHYLQTAITTSATASQTVPEPAADTSQTTGADTTPSMMMPADNEFILHVATYIKEHIADADMRIEDIASHCNMSRTPFFKKLKSITGKSPLELVRTARMEHAEAMLKTGGYTVKEVAYACGFNDIGYFSKVFKQHFGVLPTAVVRNF